MEFGQPLVQVDVMENVRPDDGVHRPVGQLRDRVNVLEAEVRCSPVKDVEGGPADINRYDPIASASDRDRKSSRAGAEIHHCPPAGNRAQCLDHAFELDRRVCRGPDNLGGPILIRRTIEVSLLSLKIA